MKTFKDILNRSLTCLLALIFGMILIIPVLLFAEKNLTLAANALTSEFDELNLTNKQDIVSTEKENLPLVLKSYAEEYSNPFDTETKQMMSGVSITPPSNDYGEVNLNFSVTEFSVTNLKSLFLYVFIPDEIVYSLKVQITGTANESIVWNLTVDDLTELLSQNLSGWKLLELSMSDAEQNLNENALENIIFNSINISYTDTLEINVKYSNNKFSFYHLFLADSFSGETKVIKSFLYSYYQLNESFVEGLNDLYVNDVLEISSAISYFNYLVVGKTDLKRFSNNNYTFEVKMSSPSSQETIFSNSDNFTFSEIGNYTLTISLNEYRSEGSKLILKKQLEININKLSLGYFSSTDIKITNGETRALFFSFAENVVLDSEIKVEVSDKSIAEVTYYVTHNTCQIKVLGLKKGNVNLTISAVGHKTGTDKTENLTCSTKVSVSNAQTNNLSLIILWITFAVYLIVIVIYVIICLVKARSNNVR